MTHWWITWVHVRKRPYAHWSRVRTIGSGVHSRVAIAGRIRFTFKVIFMNYV